MATHTARPIYTVANAVNPACPTTVAPTEICTACPTVNEFSILKQVQNKGNGSWSDEAYYAYGDTISYKVDVVVDIDRDADYVITDGIIMLYDVTTPAGDGGLWGRELASQNEAWLQAPADANLFTSRLKDVVYNGDNALNVLNEGDALTATFEYTMQTDLVSSVDIAKGIENVAFAVLMLEYEWTNPETGNTQTKYHAVPLATPDDMNCTAPLSAQIESAISAPVTDRGAFATMGSTAQVHIVRPFPVAENGSQIALNTAGSSERVFGTKIDQTEIAVEYRAQTLYTDEKATETTTDIETVEADFMTYNEGLSTARDAILARENDAAITYDLLDIFPTIADGCLKKADGQSLYFYTCETPLTLSGAYALNSPVTIVLTDAGIDVAADVLFDRAVPAFVVTGDHHVRIENDTEVIEGAYIFASETGHIGAFQSYDADRITPLSHRQLRVAGLLAGGIPPNWPKAVCMWEPTPSKHCWSQTLSLKWIVVSSTKRRRFWRS